MTEQVNVSESGQNQNSQPVVTQNTVPATTSSMEKLLRQSEVNELIGSAKHSAYEKGKQEALASLQQQNVNTSVAQPAVNQQAQSVQPQLTPEQERRIADQTYQRVQNDQMIHQFALKMSDGTKKYSDFDNVVTPLQMQNIPNVVHLANVFDNTADIMYDLGKNPTKISNLMILTQINPQLAYKEMQNLSDSIKKNEAALANQQNVREPLSQIKSSNVGAGSGKLSIAELRQNPLYRV